MENFAFLFLMTFFSSNSYHRQQFILRRYKKIYYLNNHLCTIYVTTKDIQRKIDIDMKTKVIERESKNII